MVAEVNAEISIGQNTTQEDGEDKCHPSIDRKDRLNPGGPSGLQVSCEWAEKGMAAHSSTPAWRIPWTEEPGGLQSTGSQRVGHD